MKKLFSICLVLLIILSISTPGYCNGPIKKLTRGVSNIATFPFEMYNRIKETNDRSGVMMAATYGVVEGFAMMVFRLAAGMYEVATFPIPMPEKYEPILKDPEFFFERSPKK